MGFSAVQVLARAANTVPKDAASIRDAANWFGRSENVNFREKKVRVDHLPFSYRFPPHSVTILELTVTQWSLRTCCMFQISLIVPTITCSSNELPTAGPGAPIRYFQAFAKAGGK